MLSLYWMLYRMLYWIFCEIKSIKYAEINTKLIIEFTCICKFHINNNFQTQYIYIYIKIKIKIAVQLYVACIILFLQLHRGKVYWNSHVYYRKHIRNYFWPPSPNCASRCNMVFMVIIVPAKMRRQGRRSLPSRSCIYTGGGHPRSPRGTVTPYIHSPSGHPIGRFPRHVCPASPPSLTTYFLASRWYPSHHIFSCASHFVLCASRGGSWKDA